MKRIMIESSIGVLCSDPIQIMQFIKHYVSLGYKVVRPPVTWDKCVFMYRHDTKCIDYITQDGFNYFFRHSFNLINMEDLEIK